MARTDSLIGRNFILLWQGQAVSLLGSQAYLVALMFWVSQATDRPALVGTITMVGGLATFLSPIGGTLADRYSRKRLLVLLDLISGTAMVLLAALFSVFSGEIPFLIAALFFVNIVRETCHAFFLPTVSAFIPDLVGGDRLPAANSFLHSTQQIVMIFGQGLGGVLLRMLGAPILFLVDGITFLLSGLSETLIRDPGESREQGPPSKGGFRQFCRETTAGFRFVLTNPGLRIFLILAGVYNFFQASYFVLLPFYVKDILMERADWFGYLLAGFSLGLFIGTVLGGLASLKGRVRFLAMMLCLVFVGVFRGGLALASHPLGALALLFGAGLSTGFYGVYIVSVLQGGVPTQVRGRTFGVIQTFRWGVVPLGMGFFGLLADSGGVSISMIFLVSACVIVAVTFWAAGRAAFRELLSG